MANSHGEAGSEECLVHEINKFPTLVHCKIEITCIQAYIQMWRVYKWVNIGITLNYSNGSRMVGALQSIIFIYLQLSCKQCPFSLACRWP